MSPFEYDGRSYLRQAGDLASTGTVQPTYDSGGLLHGLLRQEDAQATPRRYHVFYLAGRPVAQLATEDQQTDRWWYLTTDHLGSLVVATDGSGTELWESAFEPFGRDRAAGMADGALENDIFLRFPGQWEAGVWQAASLGVESHYNVHRWYLHSSGRFNRADPLGLAGSQNLYSYVDNNPLMFTDLLGLQRGDGHLLTPEEVKKLREESCARRAFVDNYFDMREANTKKSDKYFHCKANCQATRCGDYGFDKACELSDLRESLDQLFGDSLVMSGRDQVANRFGRERARQRPNANCKIICARWRPNGLSPIY